MEERILKGVASIYKLLTQITQKTKPEKLIYQISSNTTFLKAKANCFGIEQVLISFVEFGKDNKLKNHIDCYLSFGEALCLCNDILSGKIHKLITIEKSKGEKYPAPSYTSPLGGVNEENCKKRKLRTDGKALSRVFTIGAGTKAEYIIVAEQRSGVSAPNGIIVPDKGKAEVTIRVPADSKVIKEFALLVQTHINAYISGQYARNAYSADNKERE